MAANDVIVNRKKGNKCLQKKVCFWFAERLARSLASIAGVGVSGFFFPLSEWWR
jgi:hypothetical protein